MRSEEKELVIVWDKMHECPCMSHFVFELFFYPNILDVSLHSSVMLTDGQTSSKTLVKYFTCVRVSSLVVNFLNRTDMSDYESK